MTLPGKGKYASSQYFALNGVGGRSHINPLPSSQPCSLKISVGMPSLARGVFDFGSPP